MYDLVPMAADTAHHLTYLADVKPNTPPGAAKVNEVAGWVLWTVTIVCAIGFIIVGGKMALDHSRGGGSEHSKAFGTVLAGCLVVGLASQLANALI